MSADAPLLINDARFQRGMAGIRSKKTEGMLGSPFDLTGKLFVVSLEAPRSFEFHGVQLAVEIFDEILDVLEAFHSPCFDVFVSFALLLLPFLGPEPGVL